MSDPIHTAAHLGSGYPPPATAAAPRWGTPFFRMARENPHYRWWRPLVEGLTFIGFYLLFTMAVAVLALIVKVVAPDHIHLYENAGRQSDINPRQPIDFVLINLMLINLIPASLLAAKVGGKRASGQVISVESRFRKTLFWRSARLFLPVYLLISVIGLFTDGATADFSWTSVVAVIVVLLCTPLQAMAEEVAFRGTFLQVLGAWTRHPILPIVISTVLFTLAHGYNTHGQIDIAVFAVCTAVMAWVTGGLEIPMALHVVNNTMTLLVVSFGAAQISDDVSLVTSLLGCSITIGLTLIIVFVPKVVGVESWKKPHELPPSHPGPVVQIHN